MRRCTALDFDSIDAIINEAAKVYRGKYPWAAAVWAIRLYERHGFRLVSPEEKDRLLNKYRNISERQRETSVVLAYK